MKNGRQKAPGKAARPPAPPSAEAECEGQRLLMALPQNNAEIGDRLGTSRQAVAKWRTGDGRPGPVQRAKIADVFGIPTETWDAVSASSPPQTPEKPPAPPEAEPTSRLEAIDQLLRAVRAERAKGGLVQTAMQKAIENEMKLLEMRSKAEEAAELLETRIVTKHPAWVRIRVGLLRVLKPHPVALREVVDLLAEIGV